MKTGIIAEYNPLHNGHLYHLKKTKELRPSDDIVIAMAGNFTQRGKPAVIDKYLRASHAIKAGADIVIELPIPFAVANAEKYALGAVKALCAFDDFDTLSFGCECDDINGLLTASNIFSEEPVEISRDIKDRLSQGESYIKARESAYLSYCKLKDVSPIDISKPNTVLALEYLKAIAKLNTDVKPLAIKRIGEYKGDLDQPLPSSSGIRKTADISQVKGLMPDYAFLDFSQKSHESCLNDIIMAKLATMNKQQLEAIYDVNEGLENRIIHTLEQSACYEEFFDRLTTKRYSNAKLNRIMLYCLLNLTKQLFSLCSQSPMPINVLAINKDKKRLLSQLESSCLTTSFKDLSELDTPTAKLIVLADKLYTVIKKRLPSNSGMLII